MESSGETPKCEPQPQKECGPSRLRAAVQNCHVHCHDSTGQLPQPRLDKLMRHGRACIMQVCLIDYVWHGIQSRMLPLVQHRDFKPGTT